MANSETLPKQVVAIGASAGGLAALRSMLPHLPVNQGVAYILAQHMDPAHPSLLDKILQRDTQLVVKAASDQESVVADHLFIVPPDQEGTVVDGKLHLTSSDHAQGPRHTVDILFLSIAKAYTASGVGVILSGSGSDGLQGVRAIKAAEGFVIVQDPSSADFTGMPGAIIHERLADVITRPEEIGRELLRLLEWPKNASLPLETEADTFHALVRTLIRKTGLAFDQYKETTLRRRVERRRIVTQQKDLKGYLDLVEKSDTEAELLLQDTLISVTEFFRDVQTFEAIRAAIKVLVSNKQARSTIRVWTPGCATGEEAYSIAMLLADEIENAQRTLSVQIFATDIDEQAISVARKSIYLKTALSEVAPEFVKKYCVATDGTYQIAPSIRDMVTFAKHDLMQDPPFSRVDLISCRNVLIYFKRPTQERLMGVFHYALATGGYLVLGPSESTGKLTELFEPFDAHARVFLRRELEARLPSYLRSKNAVPELPVFTDTTAGISQEQTVRDLVFDQYAPTSVLVDQRFNILHSHGDTRRFLQVPVGNISTNLLDMATAALRIELRMVLQKCEREQAQVRSHPIIIKDDVGHSSVTLVAIPLGTRRDLNKKTLVLFEAQALSKQIDVAMTPESMTTFRVLELEQDLTATRDHLQTNIEELEASNEELQSVNEEYQSTTEELQSANEELQTTNEELQSTNEELSTVNEELRVRSEELVHTNRDLENILNTVVSGIVVLDNNLRVTRYSAASRQVFDLLPTSIGMPLIAVGGTIDLALLSKEIQRALSSGTLVERELELGDKVFLVRLVPQFSNQDKTGLVITFVDATESLATARESRQLAAVLKDSTDAITVQLRDGSIIAWNRGAEQMYGYDEASALSMNVNEIVPALERPKWRAMVKRLFAGDQISTVDAIRLRKDGHELEVSIAISLLRDQNAEPFAVATTERDITMIREAETHRRQAEIALEARLTTAGAMAAGLAHELNQPVTSIIHFCDVALSIAKEFDSKRRAELIDVLTDATAQSHRAGEIIRNLRRFLGRRNSVRTVQQINDVIKATAEFIHMDCKRHQVELCIEFADNLPEVMIDETQIGQVLVNLVKNSIEAMANVDSDARKIKITTLQDDNLVHSVQVRVQDTGSGLNQKTVERLFDPFHTEKPNGLGMGLWISRSLIENHGGRLWADANTQRGAVFHFSLPVADEDNNPG